jgi:hypothetical protein
MSNAQGVGQPQTWSRGTAADVWGSHGANSGDGEHRVLHGITTISGVLNGVDRAAGASRG